ncbi:hypothetical protein V5O48_016309 [Marasmius crinis-equi]|uniref:Uncharacterized protein n=1 Tax=Marasmius crinis-equi TaxID=585013 RepID=A0ABR3ES28_9AGAR
MPPFCNTSDSIQMGNNRTRLCPRTQSTSGNKRAAQKDRNQEDDTPKSPSPQPEGSALSKSLAPYPKPKPAYRKLSGTPATNASFDNVTAAEVLAGMNSTKSPREEAMLDDGGSHHRGPLNDEGRHENSPKNSKSSRKSRGSMEDEDEDEQDDNGSDLDLDLDSDLGV